MSDDRKEATIETTFNKACRRAGGDPVKFVSPGRAGMPDRLVKWPHGVTTYAELKRPTGGERSALQEHEVGDFLAKGHLAMFINDEAGIAVFVRLSLERVAKAEAQ